MRIKLRIHGTFGELLKMSLQLGRELERKKKKKRRKKKKKQRTGPQIRELETG